MTTNTTIAEDRLTKLGIHLPDAPTPFGAYVPAVQTGNLFFLSGMLATSGLAATAVGIVGKDLDVKAGREAAYTAEDFKALVSTNLEGFLYITQLAIKQMLAQKSGGSIVTITAALARNPIRGVPAAVPMITKGGLETVTQHLAMEYAKDGIRVNAVAPGVVYTRLHQNTPKDVMESLSPMGRPSTVKEIADAVLFLTDASTVTGHILYVDGGAHFGRW